MLLFLLLICVPSIVTRPMLVLVTVIALLTQVLVAVTLEALPSIQKLISTGHSAPESVFAGLIGPVRYFVLDFVWRFLTGRGLAGADDRAFLTHRICRSSPTGGHHRRTRIRQDRR